MNPQIATQPLITVQQAREAVEQELEAFYARQLARARAIDSGYLRLWQIARDVAMAGGKRLRPYLLLLAYQGAGGQNMAGARSAAAAIELLHISLLVHDDIIDRDLQRHGQPNIAGRYHPVYAGSGTADVGHYADGAALLAGDLGISGAYQLLMDSSFSGEERILAARLLADAIFDVAGGQLLDMEAGLQPPSVPDSLKIAQFKTSSYSFVAPLLMGASLAGADDTTVQALTAYGNALGVAFQLADDVLGLFGDEAVTGKSAKSDLAGGKPTFLMQQALARSGPAEREELAALLGSRTLTEAQAARARALVEQSGARQETERRIAAYAQAAREAADKTALQPEAIAALQDCIVRATERRR